MLASLFAEAAIATAVFSAAQAPATPPVEAILPTPAMSPSRLEATLPAPAGAANNWLMCDGYGEPAGIATKGLRVLLFPLVALSPYQAPQPPAAEARAKGRAGVAACDAVLAAPASDDGWQRHVTLSHARALHLFDAGADESVSAAVASVTAAAGKRAADGLFARQTGLMLNILGEAARLAAGDGAAAARLAAISAARPYALSVQRAVAVALARPGVDAALQAAVTARLVALDPDGWLFESSLAALAGDAAQAARATEAAFTTRAAQPPGLQRAMNGPIDATLFGDQAGWDLQTEQMALLWASYALAAGDGASAARANAAFAARKAARAATDAANPRSSERLARARAALDDRAAALLANKVPRLSGFDDAKWRAGLSGLLWADMPFVTAERPANRFSAKGFGSPVGFDGRADNNKPLMWASFQGSRTPPGQAQEMALLRAAQMAAANGADRLVVLHERNLVQQTVQTQMMTGQTTASGVSGYLTQYVFVPFRSADVLPPGPDAWRSAAPRALDVQAVIAALAPLYATAKR